MRFPLLAPEAAEGASSAPDVGAPAAAPSASSPAAAQRAATPMAIDGSKTRTTQRQAALAKVDKHAMGRAMADMRTAREANVDTATNERPRAADGRFAPKSPADVGASQGARATEATSQETAPAGESAKAKESAAVPAEVQAKLTSLEKRYSESEQRLREGSIAASEKIADITLERDHYKELFERACMTVKQATGRDIDKRDIDMAKLAMENKRYQRGDQVRKAQATMGEVNQIAGQFTAKARELIARHPEMDPHKSAEARDFWETRLRPVNGVPATLEDIMRDASVYATVLRGRQAAALQAAQAAAQPAAPVARERPQSTLPGGQAGSQGNAAVSAPGSRNAHVSNGAIKDHMAKFRAIRGGRG